LLDRILIEEHGRHTTVIESKSGEVGMDEALILDAGNRFLT
jgi:G3E family GTPase